MRRQCLRLVVPILGLPACTPSPGNAGGFATGAGTTGNGSSTTAATGSQTESATDPNPTTGDDADGDEETSEGNGPKLDVEANTGGIGGDQCSVAPGRRNDRDTIAFSNIWIADGEEASVVKVDTRDLEILARYRVHADSLALPSRTSVNLNGDVAVANRGIKPDGTVGQSGVTVIAARLDDCVDANGDGQITTSGSGEELLPWGDDECVLWHHPFDRRSNRPVAWTSGTYNEDTCRWDDPMLWTATNEGGPDDGGGGLPGGKGDVGTTDARVYLLNGTTGEVDGEVVLSDWDAQDNRGVYGGAVDSAGDFWFVAPSQGKLGHVRLDDLSYETFEVPGGIYGVMVDSEDRVWIANGSISRFDPTTQTWDTGQCGCTQIAESPSGGFWTNMGAEVDLETLTVEANPDPFQDPFGIGWGISFDVDGYLWGVGENFRRVDVETSEYSIIVPGFGNYYTYSDMTGWGLLNVQPEG